MPEERIFHIVKARIYLARYGRIDPFSWDDKPNSEMYIYHKALNELIENENALTHTNENTLRLTRVNEKGNQWLNRNLAQL